jgi:hypothetical protein
MVFRAAWPLGVLSKNIINEFGVSASARRKRETDTKSTKGSDSFVSVFDVISVA